MKRHRGNRTGTHTGRQRLDGKELGNRPVGHATTRPRLRARLCARLCAWLEALRAASCEHHLALASGKPGLRALRKSLSTTSFFQSSFSSVTSKLVKRIRSPVSRCMNWNLSCPWSSIVLPGKGTPPGGTHRALASRTRQRCRRFCPETDASTFRARTRKGLSGSHRSHHA